MEKYTYLIFDKEMTDPVRKETSVGKELVDKLHGIFENSNSDIEFIGPHPTIDGEAVQWFVIEKANGNRTYTHFIKLEINSLYEESLKVHNK